MEVQEIKEAYKSKSIEINGREYKFAQMNHEKRKGIFAIFSKYKSSIQSDDFSFMINKDFVEMEKSLFAMILFEGGQLSKSPDHWEKFPGDYLPLVLKACVVVCYPFTQGVNGG